MNGKTKRKKIKKAEYDKIHSASKNINIILTTVGIVASTYFYEVGPFTAFCGAVLLTNYLYFKGVNAIGWILEEILHLKHKHRI